MAGDFCFRIASLAVLLLVLGSAAAGRKGRCEVCKNFVKAFEEVSSKWEKKKDFLEQLAPYL